MTAAVRATHGVAYTAGRAAPKPRVERVIDGRELRGRQTVRADVCVIGTGAGGAPVAKELAEGGMTVAMLEEGRRFTTDDFNARPREMTALLYRDAGQIATVGNVPILLPLGSGVGGTTVINSGTCFRTPDAVLDSWQRRFGLDELSAEALDPYFRRVERELNVAQVPPELAGRNAHVVKRGADRLGWSGDFIYRNAAGCLGSGVCAFGCPTSAKQHTGLTYAARAWEAGASTYTRTRAEALDLRGGHVRAVEASTAGGGRLRVDCERVVVACGAIHTPLFLARQRLGGHSGNLGRNLAIHPATAVRALFDETIEMARGVPQSFYIDEFADDGIMFEGAAGPPDYLATSLPFSGRAHRELMARYLNLSQFGVMVSDRSRGRVRALGRRALILYDLCPDDLATMRRGIELLCELYFAAGARVVYPPVEGVPELRDGDLSPLHARPASPSGLTLLGFHPLGTARADARRDHGVVDQDLAVYDASGVYVADASVIPSSLGVNPQVTIMALATRLAYRLLGKPAPDDEPHPEAIARPAIRKVHALTA